MRLDGDKGFRAAFHGPGIEPVTRLAATATNEETLDLYKKSVRIGHDPTEGMIDMEVVAPTPSRATTSRWR